MTSGKRIYGNDPLSGAMSGYGKLRQWSGQDGRSRENPYSCTFLERNEPLIQWKFSPSDKKWKTGYVSSLFGGPSAFGPSDAERAKTLSRNLNKVLDVYKVFDFNMAVFLGELPETASMISRSGISVLKAFSALKKGRFDKALQILKQANLDRGRRFRVDKDASSGYLALRYGWIPLLGDMHDASAAYQTWRVGNRSRYIEIVARSRTWAKPPNHPSWTRTVVTRYQTKMKCLWVLDEMTALGLDNPYQVAWELLPFSFVIDWIINIGGWLELQFGLPSGGNVTYVNTKRELQAYKFTGKFSNYVIRDFGSFLYKSLNTTRTVTNSAPIPLPRIRSPFNGKLTRVGDMVALARQLIKG